MRSCQHADEMFIRRYHGKLGKHGEVLQHKPMQKRRNDFTRAMKGAYLAVIFSCVLKWCFQQCINRRQVLSQRSSLATTCNIFSLGHGSTRAWFLHHSSCTSQFRSGRWQTAEVRRCLRRPHVAWKANHLPVEKERNINKGSY